MMESSRDCNPGKSGGSILDQALFLDRIKEDDLKNNTQIQALMSIAEECTPEERAAAYKEHGDDYYKGGRVHYPNAIEYYKRALNEKVCNLDTKVEILENLANINLNLENYRSAISYCKDLLKLNPKKLEVYYTIASAYSGVECWEEAEKACMNAGKECINSSRFMKLLEKINEGKRNLKQKQLEAKKKAQNKSKDISIFTKRLKESGIKIFPRSAQNDISPYLRILNGINYNGMQVRVTCNEIGELCWPVVFFYPEYEVSDFIAAFNENSRFIDHIYQMFSDNPPEWDRQGLYKFDKINVFFVCMDQSSKKPLSKKPRLCAVNTHSTLKEVLKSPEMYVSEGYIGFMLMPRRTKFFESILSNYELTEM